MKNQFSLQINLNQYHLSLILKNNRLNVIGYTFSQWNLCKQDPKQIFNQFYEDHHMKFINFPQINTLQKFIQNINENRDNLNLQKRETHFCIKIQQKFIDLQLNKKQLVQKKFSLREVKYPNKIPYSSIVKIVTFYKDKIFTIGSGVLISKNTIISVAHIFFNRRLRLKYDKVQVYIQEQFKMTQIQIKSIQIPQQYQEHSIQFGQESEKINFKISDQDAHFYDFAHLQIQQNIINQNQILQISWEYQSEPFQIVGFPCKRSEKHMQLDINFAQNLKLFHLKCQKPIKKLINCLTYDEKTIEGLSGGPIIISKNGNFKVIGLHQAKIGQFGFSRGLLFSFKKNSYQILKEIKALENLIYKNTQDDCSYYQIQVQQKIQKLQNQNKALKAKLQNLQNQKFKKSFQTKAQVDQNQKKVMLKQKCSLQKKHQSKNKTLSQKKLKSIKNIKNIKKSCQKSNKNIFTSKSPNKQKVYTLTNSPIKISKSKQQKTNSKEISPIKNNNKQNTKYSQRPLKNQYSKTNNTIYQEKKVQPNDIHQTNFQNKGLIHSKDEKRQVYTQDQNVLPKQQNKNDLRIRQSIRRFGQHSVVIDKVNWFRLHNQNIKFDDIKVLVDGNWSHIQVLNLSNNNINNDGFQLLMKKGWQNLKQLWLTSNSISNLQSLNFIFTQNLIKLKLQGNNLSQNEAKYLVKKNWKSLSFLSLGFNLKNQQSWKIMGQNSLKQFLKLKILHVYQSGSLSIKVKQNISQWWRQRPPYRQLKWFIKISDKNPKGLGQKYPR